ncbi:hypothetical protein [Altericista sp. CCNU0014]|uniref:hypothetical protein n=1 Tax=Altericista sp. CCNU0014 TaxID=3082949 RepID=UPI00385130CC
MKLTSDLKFQPGKIKSLVSLGAIAAISLLFGCSPSQQSISCPQPASTAEAATRLKQTSDLELSFLIDGTLSMQGYVNDLPDSRYSKTLRLMDSASSTGWNSANTKYYRFGTKKQPIDRETFLKAQLPVFYQSGSDFSTSRIDAALADPADNRLSLVVTDLYQKDADVRLVQNLLAQRYLEKGYAIGILAVKSEFKGTVYDVGISNQNFGYSTSGQTSRAFHPVYVMLLGSYGNINHFFDQLQRNGLNDVEHEFVIFSPQPVAEAAVLNANEIKTAPRKDILQPKSLNDGRLVVRKQQPEDPVQFLVVTKKTASQPTDVELPYRALKGVLPVEPTAIALTPTLEKYQSQSKQFQPSNTQGLQLTDWNVKDGSIRFKAKIQADQLESGIYRFQFDASPTDFIEPDWWKTWNATEGNLDGAKTHNLQPFLRGLRLRTAELMKQQKPVIARLCYAVQKK